MAVPLKLVRSLQEGDYWQTFNPANPGFRKMADKCLKGTMLGDLVYVLRASEVTQAMIGNYLSHIASQPLVHTAADAANTYTVSYTDNNPKNWFAGEYAKEMAGFSDFNMRQIERNDPWNDKVQLIALLFQMVGVFDSFKTAYNLHRVTVVHLAPDNTNVIAGSISIPTPNGIVPSLSYNQQIAGMTVSKQLAELERSEPAYVKAKLGTLIANLIVAYREVITIFNAHLSSVVFHGSADTKNLISLNVDDLTL